MKKITKSLLLGTAAGLVAVAGAQAADMPVKAAPVKYVKDLHPLRGWLLLHSRHRYLPEAGRLFKESKPSTTWAAAASPPATAPAA